MRRAIRDVTRDFTAHVIYRVTTKIMLHVACIRRASMHTDNRVCDCAGSLNESETPMSDIQNAATAAPGATPVNTAPVTAAVNAEVNPAAELEAKYAKRGKIIARYDAASEELNTFLDAVEALKGDGTSFVDWTAKAPATFRTLALVHREAVGDDVLIAIPDMETAFADPTVAKYLYNLAVNKIANAADSDDSNEAMFITPAGCFTQKFDLNAFKGIAKHLVSALHKKGLSGITVGLLKQAMQNSAFAKSQFPRVPEVAWPQIIGIAIAFAEKKGLDSSIFRYWLATRDVMVDEGEEIDLGNLSEFETEVQVSIDSTVHKGDEAPASAPAVPATPAPAAPTTA